MTDRILRSRGINTGNVNPDGVGAPLVCGALSFTAMTFTTPTVAVAIGNTAEAATQGCASATALGTTNSITAGTITVARDGIYRVEMALGGLTTTATNGAAVTVAVQKNATAISPLMTLTLTPEHDDASNGTGGGSNVRFLSLVAGDAIRSTVIASSGNVLISSGTLSVKMVSDATAYSQT